MANVQVVTHRDGTRKYVARWRDRDGLTQQRRFDTKKEANDYAKTQDVAVRNHSYIDPRAERKTFAAVTAEYTANKAPDRKPRTQAEVERIFAARITPEFGARPVGAITVAQCIAFRNRLGKTLAPETQHKVYGLFKAVLEWAVENRYIGSNPANPVKLPPVEPLAGFEGVQLTLPELNRLIVAAAEINPVYGLVVRALGTTGMRVGELAGLNVGDVHILGSKGSLDIGRTFDQRHGLSTPKTRNSVRTVPLLPEVTAALAAYLATHLRLGDPDAPLFLARATGGAYFNDHYDPPNPLLTSAANARYHPTNPRPFDPDTRFNPMAWRRRVWPVALRTADLPAGKAEMRIHDLRHTAAGLMIASGMPIAMVSRQLGHANVAITDKVYGGKLLEAREVAVEIFGAWYATQAGT